MPNHPEPETPTITVEIDLTPNEIEAVADALSRYHDVGYHPWGEQSDSLLWARIKFTRAALIAYMIEVERMRPVENLRRRPAPPVRRPSPQD